MEDSVVVALKVDGDVQVVLFVKIAPSAHTPLNDNPGVPEVRVREDGDTFVPST